MKKLPATEARNELWHNIGVVCAKVGKFREAEQAYLKALQHPITAPLLTRTSSVRRSDSLNATAAGNGDVTNGDAKRNNSIGGSNGDTMDQRDDGDTKTDNHSSNTNDNNNNNNNNNNTSVKPDDDEIDGVSLFNNRDIPTEDITTMFNLAILYEQHAKQRAAETIYRRILAQHPSYIDCYVRLASLERSAGNLDKAEDACRKALAVEEKHQEAALLLGRILYAHSIDYFLPPPPKCRCDHSCMVLM
jgi:tetratricopeptide (TPR) repeat protein